MRKFAPLLLATSLTALATWGLGWWTVPIIGAAVGVIRRTDRFASLTAGAGAALGWAGLLGITLLGAGGTTLATIAPVLRMTPGRFVLVTLAFAALLATSAAALARALVTRPSDL